MTIFKFIPSVCVELVSCEIQFVHTWTPLLVFACHTKQLLSEHISLMHCLDFKCLVYLGGIGMNNTKYARMAQNTGWHDMGLGIYMGAHQVYFILGRLDGLLGIAIACQRFVHSKV